MENIFFHEGFSQKCFPPKKSDFFKSSNVLFWLLGNGYPELGKWLVVIRIFSIHHIIVYVAFSAAIMVRRWLSRIWEINSLNIKLHIKRLCLMGYVEGYTKNSNKQVVKIKIGTTKSFDSDAIYFLSVLWQLTSSTEVSVVDFSKVKPHQHCKPLQISIFCTSLFSPKK